MAAKEHRGVEYGVRRVKDGWECTIYPKGGDWNRVSATFRGTLEQAEATCRTTIDAWWVEDSQESISAEQTDPASAD